MSKKDTDKTLHIYTRVSTTSQEKKGMSLQNQRMKGIEVSKRLGMKYVVWNEGSKSSYTDTLSTRRVVMDLMEGVRRGEVKYIYVSDIDRLSRKDKSWYILMNYFTEYGVILYVSDGNKYDITDHLDKLMLKIVGGFSQFDNEQRTKRFQDNKIRKFCDGYYVHGTTPFGFDKKIVGKGKKLVENKVNGKIVRKMYSIFSKGKTIKEIQEYLLQEKIRSPRGNMVWGQQQIINILRNEHYIGKVTFTDKRDGRVYVGKCKRLVDDRTWFEVQQRWVDYNEIMKQKSRQTHDYLLTSLLYCGVCGYLCRGVKNKRTYRNIYYCGSKEEKWRSPHYDKCDRVKSKSVNIDRLDDLVWTTYLETLKDSHILREQVKKSLLDDGKQTELGIKKQIKEKEIEKKEEEKRLHSLQRKRMEIMGWWVNDKITEKERVELEQSVEKNIFEVNGNIEGIELHMTRLYESERWIDWYKIYTDDVKKWEKLTDIQKKKDVLRHHISRVTVKYDEVEKVHNIEIYLRLPLFNDKYVVVGTEGKKRLYEIQDGTRNKELRMELTKVGRKKKVKVD
jgi:DNA invertase Pin-like site-specific DNA recombinase